MQTERKIKIIFFIDSLMLGGMHRQVLYLAKYLNRDVFDTIVCTHNSPNGGLSEEFHASGARIYDVNRTRKIDPNIVLNLLKILKSERPDIIFLTEPQNLLYFRLANTLYRGALTQIGSFRALGFWKGNRRALYMPLDVLLSKWLMRTSSRIVAVSSSVQEHFLKISPEATGKFRVIHNASDFDFKITKNPEQVRKIHGIPHDAPIILHIAHYDPWKDFDTLLKAAQTAIERRPNLVFLLAGEGPLEEDIRSKIGAMKLSRKVLLIGVQKPIYNYINAAELVVLSTNGEGFSNAILESMALGRPVIATRVGGNPELLGTDGRCGLLVAPRDFLEFANKIEFLMRDSDLRRTMGDQGIERVKELCGLERYIDSYEKLFMDVAGIHPAVEEGIRSASVRA